MKKEFDKINLYFFVLFFFFLFGIGFFGIIRGQKNVSIEENRPLENVPMFSFNYYIYNEFQDNLEKALADQMIFGQTLKKHFNKFNNLSTEFIIKTTNKMFPITCNVYKYLNNGIYLYGCDDVLVNRPKKFEEHKKNIDYSISKINNAFNNIDKNIKTHFYFINNSRSINFNNIDNIFFEYISDNLKIYTKECLNINSFEEFNKFFFKTDHHLNYWGTDYVYNEIVNMIFGNKEKTNKFADITKFDIKYYGSYSKLSSSLYYDDFIVYDYNISPYITYVNGKKTTYGSRKKYYENNFSNNMYMNHYSHFYGGDYAEVIFDFDNKSKENLLIISNSYSNSFKPLLSSHFNKTFFVDLRYYNDFVLNEYVVKNNIDKVLIIADLFSFNNNDALEME